MNFVLNINPKTIFLPWLSYITGNYIYALLGESFPSGSIKYVSVLGMMAHLMNTDQLHNCRTVYASTSGNTGSAAAEICRQMGLQLHAVVDSRIEAEKLAALKERRALITCVNGDVAERIQITREMANHDPNGVDLDQYSNVGALIGHHQITGPLIWQAMQGQIDAVVVAIGTGGSFGGIASYLCSRTPSLMSIPVDAQGSAITQAYTGAKRLLSGIGCAFIPANIKRTYPLMRRAHPFIAKDGESFHAARNFLTEEGIGIGGSGGAVVCATLDIARTLSGKRICLVFHDGASSYQSTVFSDEWMRKQHFL